MRLPSEQTIVFFGGACPDLPGRELVFPRCQWGQCARAFKAEDCQAGDLFSSWNRISILPFPIWRFILQPPDWHTWCGPAETHHCLICCKMWKILAKVRLNSIQFLCTYISHETFLDIIWRSYMPSGSRTLQIVSQPRTLRAIGTITWTWPRSWDAIGVSQMMPLWIRCSPSDFTVMGQTLLDSTHLNCWLW